MKNVVVILMIVLVILGGIVLSGGNGLGYILAVGGLLGLFIIDKKLVFGED